MKIFSKEIQNTMTSVFRPMETLDQMGWLKYLNCLICISSKHLSILYIWVSCSTGWSVLNPKSTQQFRPTTWKHWKPVPLTLWHFINHTEIRRHHHRHHHHHHHISTTVEIYQFCYFMKYIIYHQPTICVVLSFSRPTSPLRQATAMSKHAAVM